MVNEAVTLVAAAIRAHLQSRLNVIMGVSSPVIQQILDPFSDEVMEPVNWDAVEINLAPMESPVATLQCNDRSDSIVPMTIEYVTRHPDGIVSRKRCSGFQRAAIQVLSDLWVSQGEVNMCQLINIDDIRFDFIAFDGDRTGAALMFHVTMRDVMPAGYNAIHVAAVGKNWSFTPGVGTLHHLRINIVAPGPDLDPVELKCDPSSTGFLLAQCSGGETTDLDVSSVNLDVVGEVITVAGRNRTSEGPFTVSGQVSFTDPNGETTVYLLDPQVIDQD